MYASCFLVGILSVFVLQDRPSASPEDIHIDRFAKPFQLDPRLVTERQHETVELNGFIVRARIPFEKHLQSVRRSKGLSLRHAVNHLSYADFRIQLQWKTEVGNEWSETNVSVISFRALIEYLGLERFQLMDEPVNIEYLDRRLALPLPKPEEGDDWGPLATHPQLPRDRGELMMIPSHLLFRAVVPFELGEELGDHDLRCRIQVRTTVGTPMERLGYEFSPHDKTGKVWSNWSDWSRAVSFR